MAKFEIDIRDLIKLKIEAANLTELDIVCLIAIAKEVKEHAEPKK